MRTITIGNLSELRPGQRFIVRTHAKKEVFTLLKVHRDIQITSLDAFEPNEKIGDKLDFVYIDDKFNLFGTTQDFEIELVE